MRIDKWLWAARFFKTRSLAAEAVERGAVRVGDERVKPARALRPGDRLLVQRGDERIECAVLQLSDVRGPAAVAQTLYEESAASRERRSQAAAARRVAREPAAALKGRPTKRDGRKLRRLSGRTDSGPWTNAE
jgi:ribosome-associated heat shock protein Hsp15